MKYITIMKHIQKFNESNQNKRISEDIIEVINMITEYERPFDMNVFEVFDKLNTMSDEELKELYESISTNRPENNSNEENLMLDLIKYFNLI